jgi:hypothetical protein
MATLLEQIKILETKLLEKISTNGINILNFHGNVQEWNYKDYGAYSGQIPDSIPKTAKKLLLEVYAGGMNITIYTEKSFVLVQPTFWTNVGGNGGYIVEIELGESFNLSVRAARISGAGYYIYIVGYK